MNLRDAIETLRDRIVVVEDELRHDEVVDFLRSRGLEKTPLILNVEGKRVVKNLVSTRELLCEFLKIKREDLCRFLANLEYSNEIEIERDLPLRERDVDLYDLPILKYFRDDGGRYITSGVIIAKRVEDETKPENFNASIHRMMLLDKNRLVVRLVAPRHTYLMWRDAVKNDVDLRIAISIGVHPLFLFASATRVPFGKEFAYASALMGGLKLYEVDGLLFPDSEIVLIGRITRETAKEGPFIDITGTYDIVRDEPVIEIDRMFVKDDFYYYSITPAGYEHRVLMGIPYEPLIYKSISNVCRVKNVVMTPGSRFYFHAVVQIEKVTEGDGKNVILATLSANPSLKGVIVVDEDIDIYSYEDIEYAIATRFQADRDLVVVSGARGSSLDPSAGKTTAKWGIDATKYLDRKEDFERIA
jgi:UbiD family decarboxylase